MLVPVIKLMEKITHQLLLTVYMMAMELTCIQRLIYDTDNGFATVKTGVGVKTEGQLVVSGTKGYIIAQSPWWLMKKFDVRYEDSSKIEHFEPRFQGDGLRYEISDFVSKINGTDKKDYKLTAGESTIMSEFVEKFMEQKKNRKNG